MKEENKSNQMRDKIKEKMGKKVTAKNEINEDKFEKIG